jgi:hypothetical protein
LWTWFQQTDFIWLDLRNHVTNVQTFLRAMCSPMAQGTFRPLSERGFFLLFTEIFGFRSFPYRLLAFLNQFLNVLLLMLVTRKLTKSALAGFVAPLLWLSSITLILPMAWTSAYNQIQCATFLLLSLYLFIRYTETGARKFYWAQWATFVLGLGSLELAVVYPAIALLYALLFARRYLRSTIPMLAAASVVAFAIRLAGRGQANFNYELSFRPASLFATLQEHWRTLLGISAFGEPRQLPVWAIAAAMALLTAAVLGFVIAQTLKRSFVPLFLLGWFLIVIAPLLAIHNRTIQYYAAIPAIGIAMLGALGLSIAWRTHWFARVCTIALLALYAVPSLFVIHAGLSYYRYRADRGHALCQAVADAGKLNPGKILLFRNVDNDLFWSTVYYSQLQVFGWKGVFLAPDSRTLIEEDPKFDDIDRYFFPDAAVEPALRRGSMEVYEVHGKTVSHVTELYLKSLEAPVSVSVSHDLQNRTVDQLSTSPAIRRPRYVVRWGRNGTKTLQSPKDFH